MSAISYVGAVPVRAQLARLERLVAAHERFWAAVAQENPRSDVMRAFLRQHWDPWFAAWMVARPKLDRRQSIVDAAGSLRDQFVPASDDEVLTFVRTAAAELSSLRQVADQQRIPMPDLAADLANKVTAGAAQGNLEAVLDPEPGALRAVNQGARAMTYAGCDTTTMTYAGAENQSEPAVAAQAVQSLHAQQPSPFYGYVRSGPHQKIYIFSTLQDAGNWFSQHTQLEPAHDYATVFAATDLNTPVQGLEHYPSANMSNAQVGNWWLPLLGLPFGAVGGYYLRKWQESHPGRLIPLPWVGQEAAALAVAQPVTDAARRVEWPQTRALIQSAIDEVTDFDALNSAEAYVWSLDAPSRAPYAGRTPGSIVMLEGTTNIVPFSTQAQALVYLREVALTHPVALAMFERSSTHWPNPTAWRKSSDPADAQVIAQHVANRSSTQMSGAYVGAEAASSVLGAVRDRAQMLADRRTGSVVGVIHTSKDGLWHTLAFRNEDDADDWIDLATQDPAAYTYAAYFNKDDARFWPRPVIEKVSGRRAPPGTTLARRTTNVVGAVKKYYGGGGVVYNPGTQGGGAHGAAAAFLSQPVPQGGGAHGAAAAFLSRRRLNEHRDDGKALASARVQGPAAGAILTVDGQWHVYGFPTLDDAVDWIQASTRNKSNFLYAAAYEKDAYGAAYIQDEEFGGGQVAVGAALDDNRVRGKQLAGRKRGNAAGTILTTDGQWHVYGFASLDDAIDWLQSVTREKARFVYAAAYEKSADGGAYIQDEEFGQGRAAVAGSRWAA